jgi:hypothetical protein
MPALILTISGGIAYAQPPAKSLDASGIGTETLPDLGCYDGASCNLSARSLILKPSIGRFK